MAKPSNHTIEQRSTFLKAMWPNGLPPFTRLNYFIPPGTNYWHETLDGAINDQRLGWGSEYFSVGVGRAIHDRYERYRSEEIEYLPCVFVDFDFKNGLDWASVKAFTDATIPYSMMVDTGRGVHIYWLVEKPLVGNVYIAAKLAGWKNYVQTLPFGKQIDTMIIEPARVLRLPGGNNFKYEDRPEVELFPVRSHRYSWDEIPTLDGEPEIDYSTRTGYLNVGTGFTEGERNDALYKWACRELRIHGAPSPAYIIDMCRVRNSHVNNPPLAEREVIASARSAWNIWQRKNGGQFLINDGTE